MSWILKTGKDFKRSQLDWSVLLLEGLITEELSQGKGTLSTKIGWSVHLVAGPVCTGEKGSLRNIVDAAVGTVFEDILLNI